MSFKIFYKLDDHSVIKNYFDAKTRFWPIIDNALRSAAIDRGVSVRLLISQWDHTRNSTYKFLKSLQDINNVYQNVDVQVVS